MDAERIPIYWMDEVVGAGAVTTEGLYARFRCSCGPSRGMVLRLVLHTEHEAFPVGVPIPEGEELRLERIVPKKYLPGEKPVCMRLYEQWPIPEPVEKESAETEEREEPVEDATKETNLKCEEMENGGEPLVQLYEEGAPIEHLERWQEMRTRVREDGQLEILTGATPNAPTKSANHEPTPTNRQLKTNS